MPDYRVKWEFDADGARSPWVAAAQARRAQTAHGSIATVFKVTNKVTGEIFVVDQTEASVALGAPAEAVKRHVLASWLLVAARDSEANAASAGAYGERLLAGAFANDAKRIRDLAGLIEAGADIRLED